jgi:hypothetical protein
MDLYGELTVSGRDTFWPTRKRAEITMVPRLKNRRSRSFQSSPRIDGDVEPEHGCDEHAGLLGREQHDDGRARCAP